MAKRTSPPLDVVPLTLRLTPNLRDRLEAAAKEHGTSVNAEIANRLRRSLDDDRRVSNLLETRVGVGIAKLLATVISEVGKIAGFQANYSVRGAVEWHNNPYAFDFAVRAANVALDAMRPPGKIEEPKWSVGVSRAHRLEIERGLAREILREVVAGSLRYGDGTEDRFEDTRADLGELYLRLHSAIDEFKSPHDDATKTSKGRKS